MIGPVSEPVVVVILLVVVVFILKGLPLLLKKKNDNLNYDMDTIDSNAHYHYGGLFGPTYYNKPIDNSAGKGMVWHSNNEYTVWLQGVKKPLRINCDEHSDDCDVQVIKHADFWSGKRTDVLCRVDANGVRQDWNDVYVRNWDTHLADLQKTAEAKAVKNRLQKQEIFEELAGTDLPSRENSEGLD